MLRARLEGGIRNKAARGELRRGLPVGLVWGEEEGEILFHPDEAVRGVIAAIFERFAESGSVRAVWLWLLGEGLSFPLQQRPGTTCPISGSRRPIHAVHRVLTHPSYAGAYVYGRSRRERRVDDEGRVRTRAQRASGATDWQVLIVDHHPGYIDWATFEANQARIGANIRPERTSPAERCGKALPSCRGSPPAGAAGDVSPCTTRARARARLSLRGPGAGLRPGRTHLSVGGVQIDQAVDSAFLAAIAPAGIEASLAAAEVLEDDRDARLASGAERSNGTVTKRSRPSGAISPSIRTTASLPAGSRPSGKPALPLSRRRSRARPARGRSPTIAERSRTHALLAPRPRRRPGVVGAEHHRQGPQGAVADPARRGRRRRGPGGAASRARAQVAGRRHHRARRRAPPLPTAHRSAPTRTPSISCAGSLVHYDDATIAGILNRQGRRTATGERFTATIVSSLRTSGRSPATTRRRSPPDGELVTIAEAAKILGVVPSTVHRWLGDGFIAGEQLTPGAPWRIRVTDDLRSRFVEEAPPGWLAMLEATLALGVSPPDGVAACKARRARGRPCPLREEKRLENQGKCLHIPASSTRSQQQKGQCDERVQARLDVGVEHPLPDPGWPSDGRLRGPVRRSLRAEPETHWVEVSFEDRLEDDLRCRHDHPIGDSGNAERPGFPRFSRLWDVDPPQWLRPVRTGSKLCGEAVEEGPHRLGAPGFTSAMVTPSTPGAPWLVATSTHARHITSLRVSLSKRAWKRRVRSCLALR